MYNETQLSGNFCRRFWIMGILLCVCGVPLSWGQTQSEIDELKQLLNQTQQSMERMMQQHQVQMDVLQQRIEDLERQSTKTQVSQEQLEESWMQQNVESARQVTNVNSSLSLHGYYDFIFADATNSKNSSFILNELSLFLRATTQDERWTFFSELEFEVFGGDSFFFRDEAEPSELEIETAWVEFSHSDTLQVRAGKLLLPQYWQTYHYPNLTLSTRSPAMVGRIFPSNLIGLAARGEVWFANQRGLSYVAYVGNGGDSEISEADQNENKAVGGRLTAHLAGERSAFQTLDLSVSAYSGRAHNDENESVLGLDAQIRIYQWELLSELAWGEHQVQVPGAANPLTQVASDTHGYYLQLGYNIRPRWNAFYRFDELDLFDQGASPLDAHQHTVGINFRPRSNISLKFEVFGAEVDFDDDPFYGVATAIVYNF